MRYSAGLLGLAALAAASDVHELNKDTFDSFVKEHDLVLAEFFAPWCGHCKKLAPEYEEAATVLKDKDIALAKVDCTESQDLCKENGVEGYPTLKIFRGPDQVSPYSGARKAEAIVSYMTKQSLPAVSVLDSNEAHEEFKNADKVVVVGYFDKDDKSSNASFTEAAESLRDSFLFGATSDQAFAEAEGVKQPAVVLYKTFDEGKSTFEQGFTKDAIEEFVKGASVPLVGEIGPETFSGYITAGIPLAYIFAESEEERTQLSNELKPVAEKYKGKLNFATIDAAAFGQHGANINLEVGKWPAFAIHNSDTNQKFPYNTQGDINELSESNIGKFVGDVVAGEVAPSIKSESIPEKNDGPVTVVVAHNYDEIVMDDSKDVLLEFYAPWCGHCKALAPKYEELGGLFKNHGDKIVIAKVDATANDVPGQIQGFPTIKLFPKGAKSEPVDYSGNRSVKDMADFIRDKGDHKVDAYAEKEKENVETEGMPQQAPAATDKIKSAASQAAEVVKDTILEDEDVGELHDEL